MNPDYVGPGGTGSAEFSTVKVESTLNHDPLFKHGSKIPITKDFHGTGEETLLCEVRGKSWEVDATITPVATVAIYKMSPIGVTQS